MAEYRLTPAAAQDLEAIWIHTAQRWSVEQAGRLPIS
ncbi:toxin ParE1/3/4 [Janthinobacterium psychrotolerans]|uniref:Toxin ParE1/3/4 n=1 Tax=Janthinobacterium psychrotolerans TaxID=1747903 RepID=A0A1A7C2M5_9BURK|nr:toxin ParE1/3/4 [Janthinobacterium psychrotolerans]